MSNTTLDHEFMRQAIALAKQGEFAAHPNPLVGCVIVSDGKVVGQGSHLRCGEAHAEIHALNEAGEAAKGATAYVTLEPCAHTGRTGPCYEALIKAGVKRVVVANKDPNPLVNGKGIAALTAAGIAVETDCLALEAMRLNPGFFSRIQRQKPYVRVKLGMSLDAKVAMSNGESQWITSPQARQDVHLWRARSGAILTTYATLAKDDCRLTVRGIENTKQPMRVVVDQHLQSSPQSAMFAESGNTTVVVADSFPVESIKEWLLDVGYANVDCVGLPLQNQHIDMNVLLAWLADLEINDVLIEAGAHFVGALLAQGWVDELLVYVAPKLLGNNTIGMAHLPAIQQLAEHINGEYIDVEQIGPDVRLRIALSDFARAHHDHS